jgi:hypothetical protein
MEPTTQPQAEVETPEYQDGEFRRYPAKRTIHAGKPYLICRCEELVGGRWEGFITIREVRDGGTS